ncbi:DUF1275 family protein [Rhodococcus erythropolis]|uniref:DUF1275 family protein n=1 Tax=Rhodococcus erythropolis TaxID=1833 RepID=UPI0030138951
MTHEPSADPVSANLLPHSPADTVMNLYVGFLDSFAIFLIGGIFISSGNAAITPIDTWTINLPVLVGTIASALIGFVLGVVIATLLAPHRGRVLLTATLLLTVAGLTMLFIPEPVVVAFPVALAVGAVNVLLGTRGQLADTTHEVTQKWLSHNTIQPIRRRVHSSAGFIGGVAVGALSYRLLAEASLWLALAGSIAMMALTHRRPPENMATTNR